MRYQLVVQCEASAGDFDRLVAFEEGIAVGLGDAAVVDGHDIGSGEFNVFVLTDDPYATFQRIQEALGNHPPPYPVKIAYRELRGEKYTILWPPDLSDFTIA